MVNYGTNLAVVANKVDTMPRVDVGGTEVTLFDPHPIQIMGVIIAESATTIDKSCRQHF